MVLLSLHHNHIPIYSNKIIAKNSGNNKVVEVSFIEYDKKIKIISTGNKLKNLSNRWYLSVILVNSNGEFKREGKIKNNQDGARFKASLNLAPS